MEIYIYLTIWIINKGIMAIYTKGTKSNQKNLMNWKCAKKKIHPRLKWPSKWRPWQPNSNSSCLMHLIHKHQKQIYIYQKVGQFSYFLKILFESVCLLQWGRSVLQRRSNIAKSIQCYLLMWSSTGNTQIGPCFKALILLFPMTGCLEQCLSKKS